MSGIYPSLPKLAVRDSVDDDDLTDIDDEVFIRDGKNGGLKIDEDGSVKRPLMALRRKRKKSYNFDGHRLPYKVLFAPFCYGTMALAVLLGLIVLCIFTVNIFPMPITILKNWLSHDPQNTLNESYIVPCTSLKAEVVWTRSFPKLTFESPLRSNDVNQDGIEDIILGFSPGFDMTDTSEYMCTSHFGWQMPCLGGVLALNGKTGETLWTHWTSNAIFSVDCDLDLTKDNIKDCIISGRGGILRAINGRDGSSIWEIPLRELSVTEEQILSDTYDGKFIADIDGDGVEDVIASHAIQSEGIRSSEILIISGVNGNILHSLNLPDTEQLFLAPQKLVHPDGESIFVLVTSSQKQSGGLYVVSQMNLMYENLKLRKLHHDTGKGTLLPPILVDITLDGVEDIVAAMFNSTIIAYNGLSFEPIWNYTIANSEVTSIPIPGYYNDDDIPDFMVKHQIGAGFPTYYYTTATIIDGKTGKPLLEKSIEDSLSRQMSGLSVTVEGFGNDWFLYWSVDCLNHEGAKEKYQFLKDESLISETRADLCKLRFNSTLTTNLFALSQHVGPPGMSLYFSEDWKAVEFIDSVDPGSESNANLPFAPERLTSIQENHRKENIFRHENEDKLGDLIKYNTGGAYRNYEDYKGQKKFTANDFENENLADFRNENPADLRNENPADFPGDYGWKHASKWTRENSNIPANKDYDMSYDVNAGDEQSVEYRQIDEVREQRSNDDFLSNGSPDSVNNVIGNQSVATDEKNLSTQVDDFPANSGGEYEERIADGVLKVRKRELSSFRETTENTTDSTTEDVATELLIDITTDENVTSSSYLNIETKVNSTSNLTAHEENSINDTNIFQEPKEATQIYTHNFLNILQNIEEDAKIEKIFKRESLKNLNKKRSSFKGQMNLLPIIAKKYEEKLKGQRKKREAQNNRKNQIYGVQKQPPTGILLPSIFATKGKNSIDLVFPTFSKVPVILLQKDLGCIRRKKVLSEKNLQYKENDDAIIECLAERGVNHKTYEEATDRENFKIFLGEMTVYRMKLECVCPDDMLPNQSCKNISTHQSWPEHLGSLGKGYFKPLPKPNV